jgi:glycosyltransferase involved in cell wall biosynthesis
MIAYHYPPEGSSSGVQRTLKFSQYLPRNGWTPIVLTASPRAYRIRRGDQLDDVPETAIVCRAFAFDTARHLSVKGHYPKLLSLPDRWVSWFPGAVAFGMRLIREYRPRAIWSTYPIATAHLIGLTLQRLSGLPWIADFRDSMTEDNYPREERQRAAYRWIEQRTLERCARAVFTAPGALEMYARRYPEMDPAKLVVIANGYDEDSFEEAERLPSARQNRDGRVVLVHSGALYPEERDPRAFYQAVAELKRSGKVSSGTAKIVLRATGHDAYHVRLVEECGINDIVSVEPAISYRAALREMLDADGLLVFQAANCNHQVPAKIYEYVRARRPILALTDRAGDTAAALRSAGVEFIVPLDEPEAIQRVLPNFLDALRRGVARVASVEEVKGHSRRARTEALDTLLKGVLG